MRLGCLLAVSLVACGGPLDDAPASGTTTAGDSTDSSGSVGTLATGDTTSAPDSSDSLGETASEGSSGGPEGPPTTEPTMGQIALPFWVDVTGSGSLSVGDIDLSGGWGTAVIEGEVLPLLAYERQPWPEQGYVLYQALAVASDRWYVVWLYCAGGQLTDLYIEGTAGPPLTPELASGVCEGGQGETVVDVDLPGTTFALLYQGEPFTVEGPDVSLSAGTLGSLFHDGVDYVAAPFETIDCSDCGMGGWFELHMILWDAASSRACFSIAYLQEDEVVRFTYTVCLPDLSDPIGDVSVPATWEFG